MSSLYHLSDNIHVGLPAAVTRLAEGYIETAAFLEYSFFPVYVSAAQHLSTCMQPAAEQICLLYKHVNNMFSRAYTPCPQQVSQIVSNHNFKS